MTIDRSAQRATRPNSDNCLLTWNRNCVYVNVSLDSRQYKWRMCHTHAISVVLALVALINSVKIIIGTNITIIFDYKGNTLRQKKVD